MGVAAVANNQYREVYLVCMYDPPGNIIDEYLDNIDLDSLIPENIEMNSSGSSKTNSISIRSMNLCSLSIVIIPISIMILK